MPTDSRFTSFQSIRFGGSGPDAAGVQTVDMANAEAKLSMNNASGFVLLKRNILFVDPNGGAQDLLLPPEVDCDGVFLYIVNTADAAEAITVKEDSDTTTIVTVAQDKAALVVCNGTAWRAVALLA
jgi:hypothetical protein